MSAAWTSASLGDLIEPGRTITYGVVKPGDSPPDGVKFIRGGDISNGRVNVGNLRTIATGLSEQYRRTILRGGELIISLVGNPGEVAIVPEELAGANLARQAGLIPLNSTVVPKYVMYYFMSSRGRAALEAETTGAVQRVINLADLKRVRIPLPPRRVQARIASLLSAYDDLIENNTQRISTLEDMARRVYDEWFVRFRFPGSGETRFSHDRLPSGWTRCTLADVSKKIGSGATPRGGKSSYHTDGTALIRSQNIYDYRFADEGLAFLDAEQAALLDNVAVESNDVLINITGASVGRCCMAPRRYLPARVNQHVMILRANAARLNAYYLLLTINSPTTKQQLLTSAQTGATREALTKERLAQFQMVLPDFGVQRDFDTVAGNALRLGEVLADKNRNLAVARGLLIPKLISGELDVSALAEIEAAAA